MNQKVIFALFIVLVGLSILTFTSNNTAQAPQTTEPIDTADEVLGDVSIYPISHASFVMTLGDITIFNDPVGNPSAYEAYGSPDLVLLSDVHGDHLNVETLTAVADERTVILAPSAVFNELPTPLQAQVVIIQNGDTIETAGLEIEAVPMYNLPASSDTYHVKGRGNGYIVQQMPLEVNESLLPPRAQRVYIAGDTADIPEMRSLENIDIAFVPMNLPYTMDVATAAEGVLAFAPSIVYPYHYRGSDGLSDVAEFKRLVNEDNPDIEVILLDWYPEVE